MADVISQQGEEGNYQAITAVVPDWVKDVAESYELTDWFKQLWAQLAIHPTGSQGYTLSSGVIRFEGRLVEGNDELLKERIMQTLHCSPLGGHSGVRATYHKVRQLFFWPGQKIDVVNYVLSCETC